jgi:hypothetical protein
LHSFQIKIHQIQTLLRNDLLYNQIKNESMKKYRKIVIISSYVISLISSFISVLIRTNQSDDVLLINIIICVSGVIFIGVSLYEILSSTQIRTIEKIVWTICIILLNPFSGLFYLLGGRKRIIAVQDM